MMQVERRLNSHMQKLKVNNGPRQIKCANKKGAAIKQPPEKRASKNTPTAATKQQKSAQETVIVNKEYLDKLLRMSMLAEGTQPASKEAGGISHVVLDHSQVPGLGQQRSPVALGRDKYPSGAAEGSQGDRVATQRHRSVHDQWLDDLAAQAEEQKMRREAERKQSKLPVVEKEYNPWGKPGCGAPMRTSSGNLPTDFHRKAVITGPRGVEGGQSLEPKPAPHRGDRRNSSGSPRWEPHHQQPSTYSPPPPPPHHPEHQGRDGDYNPWGKPGCGAPMRTSSGNVVTDFRRKAVITGPNRDQESVAASYGHVDNTYSHSSDPQQQYRHSNQPTVPSPPQRHQTYDDDPSPPPPPHNEEDYNPWGRPGCGAPMATGPDTDYRRHAVITGPKSRAQKDLKSKNKRSVGDVPPKFSGSVHHLTSDVHPEGTSHHASKPSYGRGPGPHVDSYMMKEKDEARRRERERMEVIQQQIAEKERKKLEEKRRKEEEDRKEEERLHRERSDAERRRQIEAKAAREREDKAAKHRAMLHRTTEQARQEAQSDRMEAMALKGTHRITDHQGDKEDHFALRPPPPRQTSTLRSPSLLHAVDQASPRRDTSRPHEEGRRGVGKPPIPDHHKSKGSVARRSEESTAPPRSRIPRPTQRGAKRDSEMAVGRRDSVRDGSGSGAKKATSTIHQLNGGPTTGVSSTTMVAKKSSRRLNEPPVSPAPPRAPASPPIPTLRKKLAGAPPPPPSPPPDLPSHSRHAPPRESAISTEMQTSSGLVGAGGNRASVRASSPPVPALKKKLESGQCAVGEGSLPPLVSHGAIVADPVPIRRGQAPPPQRPLEPIVRSSVMERRGDGTGVDGGLDRVHLPPVVVGSVHDTVGDSIRPPTMTRQKRILQELAILREQIITQKLNVDEKVRNTLARKLNAQ